jgi:hypothetical protein
VTRNCGPLRGRSARPARVLYSFLLITSWLSAQAWLLPQGEGTVSLSYQNLFVRDHVYYLGDAHDIGHILSHALYLDVDYSLTDRLAVRFAVPYVVGKYYGPRPHQLPLDDGTYHSTFQDFTLDVRYNVSRRPVVFTPYFRAVIPSNNYPYFAHSAAGRDLREYHLGANFGRRLDPILPKAYLQARYSYAFVERVLGIAPNRSNAEFELGYFLTPRFSLLGMGQWMYTHSGVDFVWPLFHGGLVGDQWIHHDQIGKSSLLDLGGGFAYAVTPSWQVFFSAARSVEGRNGHLHAAVVTLGVSRSFGGRSAEDGVSLLGPGGESGPAPNKAFVCTCARTN